MYPILLESVRDSLLGWMVIGEKREGLEFSQKSDLNGNLRDFDYDLRLLAVGSQRNKIPYFTRT